MKLRVRVAGLLVNEKNEILLVMDKDDTNNGFWWGPPGGGLEDADGSLIECLKREIREETGLTVDIGRLIFVREYRQKSIATHHVEFFFEVYNAQGHIHDLNRDKPPLGDDLRRFAQWMSLKDLQEITVYPVELRDKFWEYRKTKDLPTAYLGVETE
jgi:8-oxo-dGTP diphosphatase